MFMFQRGKRVLAVLSTGATLALASGAALASTDSGVGTLRAFGQDAVSALSGLRPIVNAGAAPAISSGGSSFTVSIGDTGTVSNKLLVTVPLTITCTGQVFSSMQVEQPSVARSATRRQQLATVAALAIFVVVVAITLLPSRGQVAARLASLADPGSGSAATRLHIWHDSLSLIAHRPLTGYGPDSFGLVYPRFQTGDWTGGPLIDKAHSDLVQLAATQGCWALPHSSGWSLPYSAASGGAATSRGQSPCLGAGSPTRSPFR